MRCAPRLPMLLVALLLAAPGLLPVDGGLGEAAAANKGGGGGKSGGGGGGAKSGGGGKSGGDGAKSGGGGGSKSGGDGAKSGGGGGSKSGGDGSKSGGGGGSKSGGDGSKSGGGGGSKAGGDGPKPSADGAKSGGGGPKPAVGAAAGAGGPARAAPVPVATPALRPTPGARPAGARPVGPAPAASVAAPRPSAPVRATSVVPAAGRPRPTGVRAGAPSGQAALELRAAGRGGRTVPVGGASLWVTEGPRLVGGEDGALVAVSAPRTRDASPITGPLAVLEARLPPRPVGRLPARVHPGPVDPRTARPNPVRRLPHPEASGPPPANYGYGPRYTMWWVYPWWRYTSPTTVIVVLPGVLYPWMIGWEGPPRDGYLWLEGHTMAGYWWPGSYQPTLSPPEFYGVPYVWVDGYWIGARYVEGFWRPERRLDGDWVWVDGAYDAEGAYHPGTWEPAAPWPAGMTWEPGFFDGQQWVEGFFRPPSRAGFVWVEARVDPANGVRHNGHWLPLEQRPGHVWSPGWFDGRQWNEGTWVTSAALAAGVPSDWAPAPGAEPDGGARVAEPDLTPAGELPLAVPVP
ncbi:MAG: hypothetical protein RL071_2712 [Pseudomonadota bacterium]